jgi:hypothetical protein
MPVKVGIIDTGIGTALNMVVSARIGMRLDEAGNVQRFASSETDSFGHGTAVAHLVVDRATQCSLLSAEVFSAARPTAAQVVAEAIIWCVEAGARIINLSLGLRDDRRTLRESCQAAISQDVLLVASHPARGPATYPAIYPGVLAVNGDIRCGEGECSCLVHNQLYGASPLPPRGFSGGGASYAAARITGQAAAFFETYSDATSADLRTHLQAVALFHGREHRQAAT